MNTLQSRAAEALLISVNNVYTVSQIDAFDDNTNQMLIFINDIVAYFSLVSHRDLVTY